MSRNRGGLLNHTTTVEAKKTVAEISSMLVAGGARRVFLDYDPATLRVVAVTFLMPSFGERPFRLPARVDAVHKTLERHWRAGKVQRRYVTPDQAERVGWRIVKDWLAAQLAIVESGMVTLEEVMLPYLTDPRSGRTMFQEVRDQHLALEAPRT